MFNTSKCEKGAPIKPLNVSSSAMAQTTTSSPVQRAAPARPAANTINFVNQCPTFDVGHKQDILIADGSEKELTIKVKNMPQFKVSV